jgi:hypothetical protein
LTPALFTRSILSRRSKRSCNLLWLWRLKHRRDLSVQDFANFKKACRTDAVLADFILLDLLLRDAHRLRKLRLEHFESESTPANLSTNTSINSGWAPRRVFALCFFHIESDPARGPVIWPSPSAGQLARELLELSNLHPSFDRKSCLRPGVVVRSSPSSEGWQSVWF